MSDPIAPFDGAKIAILRGEDVLTLLRDDRPDIPFPNQWDLPGGGRDGAETPFETAARELREELSLTISQDRIIYHREEGGHSTPFMRVHFFVARWEGLSDKLIRLGDEGQCWRWMPTTEFVRRDDVVLSLRGRLSRFLNIAVGQ